MIVCLSKFIKFTQKGWILLYINYISENLKRRRRRRGMRGQRRRRRGQEGKTNEGWSYLREFSGHKAFRVQKSTMIRPRSCANSAFFFLWERIPPLSYNPSSLLTPFWSFIRSPASTTHRKSKTKQYRWQNKTTTKPSHHQDVTAWLNLKPMSLSCKRGQFLIQKGSWCGRKRVLK